MKTWLVIGIVLLICAVALAYLFLRPAATTNAITSEQDARTSCRTALASHLSDMKKQSEKWDITAIRHDSATDRWLCTLVGDGGRKLFIILNPKTGGFEVSASND